MPDKPSVPLSLGSLLLERDRPAIEASFGRSGVMIELDPAGVVALLHATGCDDLALAVTSGAEMISAAVERQIEKGNYLAGAEQIVIVLSAQHLDLGRPRTVPNWMTPRGDRGAPDLA